MKESAADVLLHPIRLRIVRALAGPAGASVQELAESLPDVPPATLYRHVNRLATAGLISIVSERAVRGAVERRYRLTTTATAGAGAERAAPEEQLRYFVTFAATLIDDFAAYLERGDPDYVRDGVGYRHIPLQLSDNEFRRMTAALAGALAPFVALGPSPKRKRRFLSTVIMPAAPRRSPSEKDDHES